MGERCFIIGNGPSLRLSDLEQLRDDVTFATNRIYRLFENSDWRPTYYVALDREIIEADLPTIVENVDTEIILDMIARPMLKSKPSRVHFLNRDRRYHLKQYSLDNIYFSSDVERRVCMGGTVTYAIMQLALYMGFTEIYLLGMDHTYTHAVDSQGRIIVNGEVQNHYYQEDKTVYLNYNYAEGVDYAYGLARDYAEKHGSEILNATRGGRLEVFKRVDIDEVLAGKSKPEAPSDIR